MTQPHPHFRAVLIEVKNSNTNFFNCCFNESTIPFDFSRRLPTQIMRHLLALSNWMDMCNSFYYAERSIRWREQPQIVLYNPFLFICSLQIVELNKILKSVNEPSQEFKINWNFFLLHARMKWQKRSHNLLGHVLWQLSDTQGFIQKLSWSWIKNKVTWEFRCSFSGDISE